MESVDYWERIQDVFELRKHKILAKDLKQLISTEQISIAQAGDMIAVLLEKNMEWMLEKVYPLLRAKPQFNIKLLDEHIIKKYCLAPEEEILDTFYAIVYEGKATTIGDVYLTNIRMIVSGQQSVKSAQKSNASPKSLVDLIGSVAGIAIRGKITQKRKNLRAEISKALKLDIDSVNILEWGYSFPMINTYNAYIGKDSFSYTLYVDIGKKKEKRIDFNIHPWREKGQSKSDFAARLPEILELIEMVVSSNQGDDFEDL